MPIVWDDWDVSYSPIDQKLVMVSAFQKWTFIKTVEVDADLISGYTLHSRPYPIEADAETVEFQPARAQIVSWTYT